jgi:hypothetical protein
MYMRKHHKEENSVRGSNPRWKDTFAIDDKGGDIYQMHRTKACFQGEKIFIRCRGQRHASRGRNGHRDAEDRDMVPGGA